MCIYLRHGFPMSATRLNLPALAESFELAKMPTSRRVASQSQP